MWKSEELMQSASWSLSLARRERKRWGEKTILKCLEIRKESHYPRSEHIQPGSAQDPRPKTTRSGSFLWDTYGQVGVHGWKRSHVIKSVLHFLRGNRTKIRRRKLVSRINLVWWFLRRNSVVLSEFCPGSSHDEPDSSTRNVRGRGGYNNAHKITTISNSYCFHKAIT